MFFNYCSFILFIQSHKAKAKENRRVYYTVHDGNEQRRIDFTLWRALARSDLAERELLNLALLRSARRRARAALLGRARARGVLRWALLGQGREVALVSNE